jgi:phosphoglycolate phosphatase
VLNGFPLRIKVILLDLDGTLLDTIADLAYAANLMRRDLGLPELLEAMVKTFVGRGLQNLVKRSVAVDAIEAPDAAFLERAMALYEKHYAQVLTRSALPFPGVTEGLNRMQQAGFRLGCVTNKAARFTLPLLEHTNLSHYFDIVLSGDSLAQKKPDPMPLLHAARHFGVAPSEMVLIGDSVNDAEAAHGAGCHLFLVPYGYSASRPVTELGADAIVAKLADALELIENVEADTRQTPTFTT